MKKNILIPYEKYEKLMCQAKMDDQTDGQCISHVQHVEMNRDKLKEYGLKIEKEKEQQVEPNFSLGIQKGEGGFEFNATGGLNSHPTDTPSIRLSPSGSQSYKRPKGPPGRRETKKNKKWEQF